MIDAVFTWVNGADPRHAQERVRYLEAETGTIARHGASQTRFNDAGELFYSLPLVRRFAPWIANIHLVTDRQRPAWLTPELQSRLGVNLVDHADIIPAAIRPTFNASSIESFLDQIPGLSERFLYFNDDVFLTAPTVQDDYFSPQPRFRGAWISDPMPPIEGLGREIRGLATRFWPGSRYRDGYVCAPGQTAKWGEVNPRTFWLGHAPHPLTRTLFAQLRERFDLEKNARFRFRSPHQIHPISLMVNLGLQTGAAKTGPEDWEYIDPRKHGHAVCKARLKRCQTDAVASLCVQSLDHAKPKTRSQIFDMLSALLKAGEGPSLPVDPNSAE